ncbi:hypothetical protein C7Y66_10980 [Chroococcidiopsis sp. CCALA 051]|uniref:hypothetical protein n=1 Tax=Chroococcidiopsis sp. CCALA 051 TaxID=869949 RepID=UPI000D0CA577|nr:hypothetical protein [Chroococcidiopsis sp. CCALA 051]MBE9018890.1 hypothetical protein [Chroococcidiopsidales cyanobacterium LEGE 13417]PSM49137.1 hypothetical protein C7Y66_10980 [Chroococcidiopsis sp. CCALA 051]
MPCYFLTRPLDPKWQRFAVYLASRIGICVVFRWDLQANQTVILYPDFPASSLGLLCLGSILGLNGKLYATDYGLAIHETVPLESIYSLERRATNATLSLHEHNRLTGGDARKFKEDYLENYRRKGYVATCLYQVRTTRHRQRIVNASVADEILHKSVKGDEV